MKCPKCGFDNLDIANFCIKCGARIDEKIPCLKCGEYISNDSIKCPRCGKAIPHRSASTMQKDEVLSSTKTKINNVFSRVSIIISITILVLVLIANLFQHWKGVSGDRIPVFSFSSSFFSGYFDRMEDYQKSIIVGYSVFYFIDFALTIAMSIVALVKISRLSDKKNICDVYKYFSVILASKVFTSVLDGIFMQKDSYLNYSTPNGVFTSTIVTSSIALIGVHLFICVGFDCFLHFRRGQVSIFIARIILGLGIFIPLLIIAQFGSIWISCEYPDGSLIDIGFFGRFLILCDELSYNYIYGSFITSFVVASISTLIAFIIISLCYSLTIYSFSCYFRGMNKFKKFRIGFYMLIIALSILATAFIISISVDVAMYENYLSYNRRVSYPGAPFYILLLTILLVGVGVTSFQIYNRANRRSMLEEKTVITE